MFVCVERMGAACFSLIGLTSDVVCVRLYYGRCVVILNPEPKLPQPSLFHCPTPLLLYTSPKACSPYMPSPNTPHTKKCHRHAYAYASSHASSHIPCISCKVMECLKKPSVPPSTLRLSLFRSSGSRGVISDGELIINSIKGV